MNGPGVGNGDTANCTHLHGESGQRAGVSQDPASESTLRGAACQEGGMGRNVCESHNAVLETLSSVAVTASVEGVINPALVVALIM